MVVSWAALSKAKERADFTFWHIVTNRYVKTIICYVVYVCLTFCFNPIFSPTNSPGNKHRFFIIKPTFHIFFGHHFHCDLTDCRHFEVPSVLSISHKQNSSINSNKFIEWRQKTSSLRFNIFSLQPRN